MCFKSKLIITNLQYLAFSAVFPCYQHFIIDYQRYNKLSFGKNNK